MLQNLSNIHIHFMIFTSNSTPVTGLVVTAQPVTAGDAGLETQVPRIRPSPWQARMECLGEKNGLFAAKKWRVNRCFLLVGIQHENESRVWTVTKMLVCFFFFELFLRMMLLAVILGVVGVSLGLLPASWNLKLAKVFVSWGIRWDFCSGYWDYWDVKTMHTSLSPIDTNTDGPWNMYLRLQNLSSFWVCSTSGGGTHNRQKPSKNWSHVMEFTPGFGSSNTSGTGCEQLVPISMGSAGRWRSHGVVWGHRLDASSFGVKM